MLYSAKEDRQRVCKLIPLYINNNQHTVVDHIIFQFNYNYRKKINNHNSLLGTLYAEGDLLIESISL